MMGCVPLPATGDRGGTCSHKLTQLCRRVRSSVCNGNLSIYPAFAHFSRGIRILPILRGERMPVYLWSETANSNATADPTINWAEGQAPSSINDSARAMMAAIAKWRDDVQGILIANGSSTAYSVTTNSGLTSVVDGFTVQFTPAATNTGPVTIAVDILGAAPLRFYTGHDLPAGVLISGSLYQATYRLASGEWLLHSFDGSIYSIPIGAGVDYWGATTPNSSFAFAQGQAVSRTTYAALFGILGTTYGAGDGLSTFNLPDKTGRVSVGVDPGGSRVSGNTFNVTTLGGVGGFERNTLSVNQIPAGIPVSVVGTASVTSTVANIVVANSVLSSNAAGGSYGQLQQPAALTSINSTGTITGAGVASGSGQSVNNVQPSICCNYIIRVL